MGVGRGSSASRNSVCREREMECYLLLEDLDTDHDGSLDIELKFTEPKAISPFPETGCTWFLAIERFGSNGFHLGGHGGCQGSRD